MLTRKIRKTIYVERMPLGKVTVRYLLQQPCHLVSWVTLAPAAKTVVSFQKQRQLLQLLRKTSFGLMGCIQKICRAYTATLKLIYGIHQFCQKFRARFNRSVRLKLAVKLARGCSHGNDLTAEFGPGLTIVNVGTMTLGYTAYYNLFGSDMMTGPTMGAIICALACTGMGGHIVNVIPIMTGYVLTSALAGFTVNTQPILVGLAYAASMSPISGHYGAVFGVAAGMLHCAIVQSVITFHHGFSVLNGGFTSCFVTMMLIPVLDTFFEKRDCVGLLPRRKKF